MAKSLLAHRDQGLAHVVLMPEMQLANVRQRAAWAGFPGWDLKTRHSHAHCGKGGVDDDAFEDRVEVSVRHLVSVQLQ